MYQALPKNSAPIPEATASAFAVEGSRDKEQPSVATACYKTLTKCQLNLPLGREGLTVVVQREFVVQLPMRPPYYSAHVVRPYPKADFLMYLGGAVIGKSHRMTVPSCQVILCMTMIGILSHRHQKVAGHVMGRRLFQAAGRSTVSFVVLGVP